MPISSLSLWKDFFFTQKHLDSSNNHLSKISAVVGPKITIETSFEEISKNPGVSLLSLDPSESKMQLFHHPKFFGGSWSSPEKQLVAVLGIDATATPIEIISKSVKDFKVKSHSLEAFSEVIVDPAALASLSNPKTNFYYKNMIPIPNLLTKTFIKLDQKDPLSVASAFFTAMYSYDDILDGFNFSNTVKPLVSVFC